MARQAITTKYHGPMNVKGSRISATSASGIKVTLDYDDALDNEAMHRQAAEALCTKLKWSGKLACGATKEGFVFVFIED